MQTEKNTAALWSLLKPALPANSSFIILVTLTLLVTCLELILPLYSRHLVDSLGYSSIDPLVIINLVVLVIFTAVLQGVMMWFGGRIGQQTNFNLRHALIGHLLKLDQRTMDKQHSAELSARVINDSKEIKTIVAQDLIGLINGSVSLLAVTLALFWLDWRLTLVILSCILVGFLLITPIALMMQGISQKLQASEAQLIKQNTEWLRNSKMIKANNASEQLHGASEPLLRQSYTQGMRETCVQALIGPISNLILMVSLVSILAFSAFWIADGSLTLGTVTAVILYLFGLTFPLISMGMFFSNLNKAAGAATRLSEITAMPTEHMGSDHAIDKVETMQLVNLHFHAHEKVILKGISQQLNGCGISMLVGGSGGGKTTLLQHWLGFYQESFSNMQLNGKSYHHYDIRSIRARFAWVDQEPGLINASVRTNLRLGLDQAIPDEALMATLNEVGLSPWLNLIDSNLDLIINEQQHQFSGGEKQRFALARALLRPSDVLLLDEPTSALDATSEAKLMKLIRTIAKQKRVIMITHKTDLITAGDDVWQIQNGQALVRSTLPFTG
jgi:ATP-binding cassette subfamily B protein AbcA/BmrA